MLHTTVASSAPLVLPQVMRASGLRDAERDQASAHLRLLAVVSTTLTSLGGRRPAGTTQARATSKRQRQRLSPLCSRSCSSWVGFHCGSGWSSHGGATCLAASMHDSGMEEKPGPAGEDKSTGRMITKWELYDDWQDRLRSLVLAGEKQPLWFRIVDTLLTLTASACFVLSTLTESRATVVVLQAVEDVINVIFVVGFLLLCWARDFKLKWLLQASALLDLASCLPVMSIFIRSSADDLAAYAQMLQVFRFLRLLRETRLITKSDRTDVPIGTEIFVLCVGFFGLIAVASTVLYIYERDSNLYVSSLTDAVFYMSNVFTSRPPPFSPTTELGKGITIVCFILALVGIPFFIAEVTAVAMKITDEEKNVRTAAETGSEIRREGDARPKPPWPGERLAARFGSLPGGGGGGGTFNPAGLSGDFGPEFWAACLQTLDRLEGDGWLSADEATSLRRTCYEEHRPVAMVMVAYASSSEERLSLRLRETLETSPRATVRQQYQAQLAAATYSTVASVDASGSNDRSDGGDNGDGSPLPPSSKADQVDAS